MEVLIVGDIHLADHPPSIRTEDYAEQILAKLEFTVSAVQNFQLGAVVWAGDVFHVKAPTRTSHALVRRVAEIGQSYGVPWLIVPGNHDMRHDRLDTLDRQPLGVLFKAGAIPCVGDVVLDELNVFGIPWLSDWQELERWMFEWRNRSSAQLMVTHAPIVQPGETRPYEVIDARRWIELMERPGDVYFGHMHDVDGAFQVDEFTFCNQGALSRGSLHESTLARKPAVTVYFPDHSYQQKFQRMEVPHLPVEQVFRKVEHDTMEARAEMLDEFLTSIGETKLDAVSVEAVHEHIRSQGLRPEVEREVLDCLEVALAR